MTGSPWWLTRNNLSMPEYLESTSDTHYKDIKPAGFDKRAWPSGAVAAGPIIAPDASGIIKTANVHIVQLKDNRQEMDIPLIALQEIPTMPILTLQCALILGLVAASLVAAAPANPSQSDVKVFTPALKSKTKFNVYKNPVSIATGAQPASFVGAASKDNGIKDKVNIAVAYFNKNHNIPTENIKVTDAYTSQQTGVTHVHIRQVVGGVEVSNGVGNVNINRQGKVISSSHSFAPTEAVKKVKRSAESLVTRADDSASVKAALKSLADYVKTSIDSSSLDKVTVATTNSITSGEPVLTLTEIPESAALDGSATAKKSFIQNADGSLTPVWSLTLEQKEAWWSAEINIATGKVESINNWVASSESYNVYPRAVDSPNDGSRQVVVNPANSAASPKGWVSSGTTIGNNVWAQNNPTGGNAWQNNYRPKAAAGNVFDYPIDLTKQPSTYVDAAIAQLFYTVNTMHDLSFLYGFDEAAGNFQDVNYSGKGRGGDGVIANAQDGSGTNNANFATPPDGQRPRMRMYVFTKTDPNRDGDFEQNIVAHEFTHGISNRLTGGPSNTNCLNDLESGGMGEGWSDTVANIIRIKVGDTRSKDTVMGQYSFGKRIRKYPYSTNTTTNPEIYSTIDDPSYQEVHAVGEVWAAILYEAIWNLIDANGISPDLFSHDLTKGNALALQIILDGMKLQPCNPDFIAARDAILQAEQNLTGGKNRCALWKGFAKRGLGEYAYTDGNGHYEDYTVPDDC
ncbi:hypothetical protein GQ54DRAFT_333282 [Martensiomyces pterosporus]|nr:hypothetical protein GQ54DRAFT_333282 [Martensiomyces pterosporus]